MIIEHSREKLIAIVSHHVTYHASVLDGTQDTDENGMRTYRSARFDLTWI